MDIKPDSEVVLPPEKGTGIRRGEPSPEEDLSLPKPKEFHFTQDSPLIREESPDRDEQSPDRDEEDVKETEELAEDVMPPPPSGSAKEPAPQRPQGEPDSPGEKTEKTEATEKAEKTEKPAKTEKTAKTDKSDKSKKSKKSEKSNQDLHRDFIIAYDGEFVGHYRSPRRITNRTAFQRVARQVQSMIEEFDIEKLRLFKPIPLKIELPESLSKKIADGSFSWFS